MVTNTKRETQEKFISSMEEMQQKVTASQESSSEEVSASLSRRHIDFDGGKILSLLT